MILIIAYGNSLRQDDGAGFVLARQLAQLLHSRGIDAQQLPVQQLVPELASDIADAAVNMVVFVDTRLETGEAVNPQVVITPLNSPESSFALAHHLDATMLLLYASQLYGQSPPAWLLTIPGTTFGYGETFSQVTNDALTNATVVLEEWIEEQVHLELMATLPKSQRLELSQDLG